MSILVKNFLFDNSLLFDLNIVTAVSVIQALELFDIPQLSIKWPNDIMSYNKKIGGVLIENSLKSDGAIVSIVGLGLNVNQTDFELLPKASSLAAICQTTFDKEELLFKIVEKLEENIRFWNQNKDLLWTDYTNLLFKKRNSNAICRRQPTKFYGNNSGSDCHWKTPNSFERRFYFGVWY